MNIENSSSTAEKPETTPTPESPPAGRTLREELSALLETENSDTPTESVADVATDVQVETESTETPTLAALDAPSNFSAEQRETFSKLPREAQEIILARHKDMQEDYTRKTTELANARKSVDEINAVLEPYKQEMELAGVKPNDVIQRLLAAQRYLQSDPVNGVKWLAQQFNVDLKAFAPKEEEAYVDPTVKALRDELNQLKASLQQREAAAQNQTVSEAQKMITAFAEAKNEDGTAKHPHYESLKSVMAPIVATGKTLEEAYDIARYTIPSEIERLKAEVAKSAQAEAVRKAEEARKNKVKEVKGAAQVIRSRGTAVDDGAKAMSLRQELEKNLRELSQGRI